MLGVKNLTVNPGDLRDAGSIPGSRGSPGGGHGNPLRYSCLGNPMDRGAWWAAVRGVAQNQTLKHLSILHTLMWWVEGSRGQGDVSEGQQMEVSRPSTSQRTTLMCAPIFWRLDLSDKIIVCAVPFSNHSAHLVPVKGRGLVRWSPRVTASDRATWSTLQS